MRNIVTCWYGIIIADILVLATVDTSYAQQTNLNLERILRVWKNRQDLVESARFELKSEEVIHKGSISALVADRRKMAGMTAESESNPPKDYLVKGRRAVSIDGTKLRYLCERQQWDPIEKKLYSEMYVDTFNGEIYKFLQNPASNQEKYPFAAIRKANVSRSALKFPVLPLILAFRGNHPNFFHELSGFQITGRNVPVAGRLCVELTKTSNRRNTRDKLYLDLERDFVVIRKMILMDDTPSWQLDVNYKTDTIVGWVPCSWEYIIRQGKDNQMLDSGHNEVVHYEINPQIKEDDFNIVFPPNTWVSDMTSGSEVQYVVKPSGEKGMEMSGAVNVSYDELKNAAKPNSKWIKIAVWATMLALALAWWYRIRIRRIRSQT